MAACFALTCVISVAYTSSDVRAVWPMILAIIVCSTAAFTLVLSRGDPMPLGQSVLVSLTGAVTSGLVLSVVPVPVNDMTQLWMFGMSTQSSPSCAFVGVQHSRGSGLDSWCW